jgi:hypothetical protein
MARRIKIDDFAALAMSEFNKIELRRRELNFLKAKYDVGIPMIIWDNKIAPGLFLIPGDPSKGDVALDPVPTPVTTTVSNAGGNLAFEDFNGIKVFSTPDSHSLVPSLNANFVPWGNYHLIKKLINHDKFMTAYITGETGNGKTLNFEQACAELKRELIVVPITAFTDEDDLFGGFRLVGGDTVWVDGPVIEAMKRGAILLLDEVDNGTEPLMSLQAVLQGNSYFVKKLGRVVEPTDGFAVFATANTKGDGDGDYVFTNVLNKAFLDRFKILVEQPYPSIAVERKIVSRWIKYNAPHVPNSWTNNITKFVDVVRNTYKEGGISEQISTRRLVDMTMMYGMLGNASEAIKLTTNRFDTDTQVAMLALWENIDDSPETDLDSFVPDEPIEAPAPITPPPVVAPPVAPPVAPKVQPAYVPPVAAPAPVAPSVPSRANSLPSVNRSDEIPF